jgi:hypothetical protein
MSRKDEFKSVSTNPAAKFLEWDSNSGAFKWYDKESGQNKFVKAPFKFVVLKELHTIKGWHDKSESGIYSNEVASLNDRLEVKSFKGGPIISGLYRDIKDQLQGGVYNKSIYVMLGDGSLANISMKGAVVATWGDFTKKSRARLSDEWVAVLKHEDMKKGSVKYTIPVFEYKNTLTDSEGEMADKAYAIMKDYLTGYFGKASEEAEQEAVSKTAHLDGGRNEDAYHFSKKEVAPHHIQEEDEDELPF